MGYPVAYRSGAAREAFNLARPPLARPPGQVIPFPSPGNPRAVPFGPPTPYGPTKPFGRPFVGPAPGPALGRLGVARAAAIAGRLSPWIGLALLLWQLKDWAVPRPGSRPDVGGYRWSCGTGGPPELWNHGQGLACAALPFNGFFNPMNSQVITSGFRPLDFWHWQDPNGLYPTAGSYRNTGRMVRVVATGPIPPQLEPKTHVLPTPAFGANPAIDARPYPIRPAIPNSLDPGLDAFPWPVTPTPRPIPYWMIPHVLPLPLSPQHRVGGYGVARPITNPRVGVVVTVGRNRPGGRPISEIEPIPVSPVNPPRKAPPSGEKEKKLNGTGRELLGRALHGFSEANDVIDVFFAALPRDIQRRYGRVEYVRKGANSRFIRINGRWVHRADGSGQATRRIVRRADLYGRGQAVYENFHRLDWGRVMTGLVANEIEDRIVGRGFRAARDGARRIDRSPNGTLWQSVQWLS